MSDMPWFQFFASDWLAGTRGLSAVETGIYITLIASMYDREEALQNDTERLARLCGASVKQFGQAIGKLIDDGKILLVDGKLWNARVEEQLKLRASKSEKAKSAADVRHSGKTEQKQRKNYADATTKQSPDDAIQKPEARDQNIEPNSAHSEPQSRAALCVEVGKKITDAMGVTDDPRWMGNWSSVSIWLAKGYDPELDIMPTVLATVDRLKKSNRQMPGSLNYFERAIGENHRRRLETGIVAKAPAPNVELVIVKAGTPEFRAWIAHWKSQGKPTKFSEKQKSITVPTLRPPEQEPKHLQGAA